MDFTKGLERMRPGHWLVGSGHGRVGNSNSVQPRMGKHVCLDSFRQSRCYRGLSVWS